MSIEQASQRVGEASAQDAARDTEKRGPREAYEAPTITKRRSVRSVVLFSGTGSSGGTAITGGG